MILLLLSFLSPSSHALTCLNLSEDLKPIVNQIDAVSLRIANWESLETDVTQELETLITLQKTYDGRITECGARSRE